MKKVLMVFASVLFLISAGECFAGDDSYKNTPEYQKMDSDMRADLQNCLNDSKMSTRDCIKHSKAKYKEQKKMLKKEYKHKMNMQ